MSAHKDPLQVSKLYVWDRFVRLFHWTLVALFLFSYLTGEDWTAIHVWSGYLIVSLLIARIVWGFVGSTHARFTDFVRSPKTVLDYARDFMGGRPAHYLGHNPLGGLMIVVMLLTLTFTTFSGMQLYAVEEGKGPLSVVEHFAAIDQAQADSGHAHEHDEHDEDEYWEEVHEFGVNLMVLLILVHVAGVVVSSKVHGESLVRAMLTGYKQRQ